MPVALVGYSAFVLGFYLSWYCDLRQLQEDKAKERQRLRRAELERRGKEYLQLLQAQEEVNRWLDDLV